VSEFSAGSQCSRAAGDLQGLQGLSPGSAYSACDGLYESGDVVEVGCLMHARRKFYETRTNDPARSNQALAWISLRYDVEREVKEREIDDYEAFVALRHRVRGERSRPIFDKFHAWLEAEQPKVLPKSAIAEAIQYALTGSKIVTSLAVPAYLVLRSGLRMTTSTSPLGWCGWRVDLTSAAVASTSAPSRTSRMSRESCVSTASRFPERLSMIRSPNRSLQVIKGM
jgi:hypothetical protein